MEKLELIEPCVEFKSSYLELISEFEDAGKPLVPFLLQLPTDNFSGLIKMLKECEEGIGIQDGWVSHSTYWLVRNKSHIVGVSNLRHKLTPNLRREGGHIGYGIRPSDRRKGYATIILRETVKKAAKRGLKKVLVTCNKDNTGSVKTILNNGGQLDSEEFLEKEGWSVQRYWIST
ncbi:GNAT family N-acetyltransferase [bacterium]|nr:GNAT family N-acetyltransferase [bacterium]